jgi:hypothetical protein
VNQRRRNFRWYHILDVHPCRPTHLDRACAQSATKDGGPRPWIRKRVRRALLRVLGPCTRLCMAFRAAYRTDYPCPRNRRAPCAPRTRRCRSRHTRHPREFRRPSQCARATRAAAKPGPGWRRVPRSACVVRRDRATGAVGTACVLREQTPGDARERAVEERVRPHAYRIVPVFPAPRHPQRLRPYRAHRARSAPQRHLERRAKRARVGRRHEPGATLGTTLYFGALLLGSALSAAI